MCSASSECFAATVGGGCVVQRRLPGPLRTPPPDVVEIFFAIFGHHPQWIKQTLLLRNRLARRCGLAVPADSGILHPTRKSAYFAGDTIGPWPVFIIQRALRGQAVTAWNVLQSLAEVRSWSPIGQNPLQVRVLFA